MASQNTKTENSSSTKTNEPELEGTKESNGSVFKCTNQCHIKHNYFFCFQIWNLAFWHWKDWIEVHQTFGQTQVSFVFNKSTNIFTPQAIQLTIDAC